MRFPQKETAFGFIIILFAQNCKKKCHKEEKVCVSVCTGNRCAHFFTTSETLQVQKSKKFRSSLFKGLWVSKGQSPLFAPGTDIHSFSQLPKFIRKCALRGVNCETIRGIVSQERGALQERAPLWNALPKSTLFGLGQYFGSCCARQLESEHFGSCEKK